MTEETSVVIIFPKISRTHGVPADPSSLRFVRMTWAVHLRREEPWPAGWKNNL